MIDQKTLVKFLNEYLEVDSVEDHHYFNGLQVEGNPSINRIGFAVDACLETIQKAKEANCEILITHHGIHFDNPVTGMNYRRIKALMLSNMGLYCSHLPLDKHHTVGNNVQLAQSLNLKNIQPLGEFGYQGELEYHESIEQFGKRVKELLNSRITVLPFGKQDVKKIAIISGSAASWLKDAVDVEADVFLTGEGKLSLFHNAKEEGMNVVLAGHYATETIGVKALATVVKDKFDVEVGFIDSPVDF